MGYVVSELVMNCAKYANGKITVSLGADPQRKGIRTFSLR